VRADRFSAFTDNDLLAPTKPNMTVTNKTMGVAEKSLLTVASLAICLTTDRVLAGELPVPSVLHPKLQALLRPELNSPFSIPQTYKSPLSAGIVQPREQGSNRGRGGAAKKRSSRAQLSPQINVSHNPDLSNIFNSSRLTDSLEIDRFSLTANPTTSGPDTDELIQQIRNSLAPEPSTRRVAPAISFVTPIGFGGQFGNVGLGVAYQQSTALGNKDDGNFGATVSLGDPIKFVGVDLSLTVNSISNSADRGGGGSLGSNTLGVQFSRQLSDDLSLGLGAENLISFDARNISTTRSFYLVATKIIPLNSDFSKPFSTLYTSVGLGNGRFLPAGRVTVQGEPGINVFGSAAVKVFDGVNGIVEWSGQDLDLAVSFVPFKDVPLAITPAVVDLFGNSQNRGARFNISVGYSLKF
jgi:hypothetical protein